MTDEAGRDHQPGDGPEVGPLAEEAARLVGALGDWARDQGGAVGSAFGDLGETASERASHWAHEVDDHLATGSAECQWCPVCRTVQAARALSPEVRTHLTTAATSLAQAAAALLAAPPAPSRQRPGDTGASGGVERIVLDDQGEGERT